MKLYRDRQNSGFAEGFLTVEESIDVLSSIIRQNATTIIIIDALDECTEASRRILLEALTTLVSRSKGLIKLFISSREEKEIDLHLRKMPNLHISATDNGKDIARYVEMEVDRAIGRKLLLGGRVHPTLKHRIVTTLTNGANGM
jgi:hypothetical protein